MRRTASIALFLLFLAPFTGAGQVAAPAAAAAPAPSAHVERLAEVGRLWGMVRYLHPYLGYRDIDWDAALVAAIPRVREAKTPEEYRAAVQGMLGVLGDPVTKVVEKTPPGASKPAAPAGGPSSLLRKLDGGVLALDVVQPLRGGDIRTVFTELAEISPEVAQAPAVVVDLRAGEGLDYITATYSGLLVEQLAGELLSRPGQAPAQRYVLHSGYRPQEGGTSGGYYSGFLTKFVDTFQPDPGPRPSSRRVVFLVDPKSRIPGLVLVMHAAGDARIVSQGTMPSESFAETRMQELGDGLMAVVRVSETVPFPGWRGARADVEVPEGERDAAFEAAVAEARKPWPPAAAAASPPQLLPEAVFRPDKPYADMKEPSLEYRQLAVIRAWNVIHWFYPYLHLIGEWDAVLPEYLARMEGAKTFRDYALTLTEMMSHVADGHTGLWGHPDVEQPFGDARLPIQVRWTEGAAVAWRVSDEVRQAGIDVGDAILEVDGETVEARVERLGRYTTASTPAALRNRILGRFLLVGPAGSTAVLKVQKLGGTVREVRLVRDPKKTLPPEEKGEVVRILPGNLGYVDLTRLTVPEVDGMFDTIKGTRAIIFDMRGYPQGTAWPIAPRINTRKAKIGAQFRRSQVSAFSVEEAESGFHFSQPLPELPEGEELYTGPTVMLIDDRAISQSEHTGLFFEAANDTRFIGTATAGANGDVTRFPVPGGIWIGFTGHDVRHADGRQLQRVGLVPHVEVAPTRAGLKAGRDEVLERAVAYLEEALK